MPATLADSTEVGRYRLNPDAPDLPSATVRAPCCGRTCAADMVADLRGTPGTVTSPGQMGGPRTNLDWACDGCRERLAREDGWSRSRIKDVRGYPSSEVLLERAKERARQRAEVAEGPYRMDELLAEAKRELRST